MTNDTAPLATDLPPDWEALARYHAGESPEAEARALRAWLAAHPADAAMLAELHGATDRAMAAPALDEASLDVEAALRRVKARRSTPVVPLQPRRALRAWWAVGGLAAAAVAVIGVTLAGRDADRET